MSAAPATSLLGMAGSLLLVLAAIFALAWLLRRTQGLRVAGMHQVRVLGGTSVGARERVLLVEAAGQHFLLGVAPGAVNLLHHYEGELPEAPAAGAELPPFAQKLQQMMRGRSEG